MAELRHNPDGPPALVLSWYEAQDLVERLQQAIETEILENGMKLPQDATLCLMWQDWPFSININC